MKKPKIELIRGGSLGRSVITRTPIFAGEILASFDGPVYSWEGCKERYRLPRSVRDHGVQFHPFHCRDSDGIARWVNHSCEPNCGIRNLFELVAMREIAPGEEVTFDYEMAENDDWEMACRCGAATCRGLIRGFRYLPKEKRDEYAGFLSEWHFDPYIADRRFPSLLPANGTRKNSPTQRPKV